jgi:pimeloyl-ACP methyl ester carboxylesterase
MKINQLEKVYTGANNRLSLLDVSYPESDAKLPLIIFSHGFKGYKDWGPFPLIAKKIANAGFFFLKFNFSHNGGTVENPIDFADLDAFSKNTYSKEILDLKLVLDFIKNDLELSKRIDFNSVNLLGHSRGGAISLLAASQFKDITSVTTWAAVDNLLKRLPKEKELENWKEKGVRYILNSRTKQNMPIKYGFVEDLYKNKEKLDVLESAKSLKIPQLILHGKEDETVNYMAAINIHKANPNSKLELIENANHTFGSVHPYTKVSLVEHTQLVVNKTISFLKT